MLRFVRPAILAIALATPLVGCQGLGMQSAQEQAMALLSDGVKSQVSSYLADVDSVTALLKNVNSIQSALDTAPKLAPYVTKLQDGYTSLSSLDPETLKNVRTAFKPELVEAAEGFSTQLTRMADSGTFGKIVKPVLEKVSLFQ
ncbi:MAG: hypothetical protein JNM94_05200 [Phycisphaerae bacterium]|nr:hypothetical protein [Phycisphaerae bacterium]